MLKRAAQRGFTLIEVMLTLVVLGVLVSLAGPSFNAWQQSAQIRAASEALQNGLQRARGAAINRNVPVQIAIGPGTGWTINEITPPNVVGAVVETRSHQEGTTNAVFTPTPLGATMVTFSTLGGVAANSDASAPFTQVDITNPGGGNCSTAGGPMRCLRVVVSPGGSIRMCDPKLSGLTPPDPRGC